jgi:cell division protease FtsH
MAMAKDFSEATAKLIDDEVRRFISEKEKEMLELFKAHKKEILALSERLVEKEMIYADEIRSIVGL